MALVLFFGPLSDLAGRREMVLPREVRTVADLAVHLGCDDPALAEALEAEGVSVAVNRVMATSETAVSGEDEIAFMSPMSGG